MGIKVALEHRTSYTFDRLVEVHPTSSGCVRRRIHALRSRPTRCRWSPPTTSSTGNKTRSATSWLVWCLTVGLTADLKVINPFDFFIEPYAEHIGFDYPKALAEGLKRYLRPVDEEGE